MGFSRQEYWSGLPLPSPVNHILSELYTMTHPSWVALHGMAHSFIELDKAMVHVIILIRSLWSCHHWSMPLMETPGYSEASLGQSLVGSLLLLLGSGTRKVLFVPSMSLFPQSCVSCGGSMVGLKAISSRGLIPHPGLLHPEPLPLKQATADPYLRRRHSLKDRSDWVSVGLLVCTRFCLRLLSISGGYGVLF